MSQDDKISRGNEFFDKICKGLGLPEEVIDLLKQEPGTEVDFGKPVGWYDSCFPTKDLHDKWMDSLRDPLPDPRIPDDIIGGFENNSLMSFYKQWRDAIASDTVIPKTFPVWVKIKLPSKLQGRKGTRKGWKRLNPPRWMEIDLEGIHERLTVEDKKDEST